MKRVHRGERRKLHEQVGALSGFPEVKNVKALTNHQYPYRLRVGNYRVFFEHEEQIKVVRIEEVRKRDERTY